MFCRSAFFDRFLSQETVGKINGFCQGFACQTDKSNKNREKTKCLRRFAFWNLQGYNFSITKGVVLMKQQKITVYEIVLIGLMAALCFVGTYLHIDVPTPLGKVMLHFGNVFCLLSGMLLGGVRGGLAAGIGSMFYDLIDPIYISESWITFINKFMMAFLCGIIVQYTMKKIAAMHQRMEDGKAPIDRKITLTVSVVSSVLLAVIAVLVGMQGYRAFSGLFAEEADVFAGIVRLIGAAALIAVCVFGIVFSIRQLKAKPADTDSKAQKMLFGGRLAGGIAGILGYLLLYLSKNFIMGMLEGQEMATIYTTLITKGSVSLINGIIAIVVSLILVPYFVMALKRSGLDRRIMIGKEK